MAKSAGVTSRRAPATSQPRGAADPMRAVVLVLTLLFAIGAIVIRWGVLRWHPSSSLWMVSAVGMTRFALVLGTLWLAWPTVRRPAMWLPPSVAMIAVIALGACVVQPRLAIALVPAVGALIAVAGFLRFFRDPSQPSRR